MSLARTEGLEELSVCAADPGSQVLWTGELIFHSQSPTVWNTLSKASLEGQDVSNRDGWAQAAAPG